MKTEGESTFTLRTPRLARAYQLDAFTEGETFQLCEAKPAELLATMPDTQLESPILTLNASDSTCETAMALGCKLMSLRTTIRTQLPCTERFSRLLLPVFGNVQDTDGDFALNDNTLNSGSWAIMREGETVEAAKPSESVPAAIRNRDYLAQAEYILKAGALPSHLTKHQRIVLQLREVLPSRCLPLGR